MSNPIPKPALAHHIAFLGKTGSGKSNGAKVLAEEALDASERVCIVDPTGAWWGLRLKADGKPSNYPVVIFGGLHADVPISRGHGATVAEVIATSATPAVIDTRLMTVGERTEFFTDFAETLLRKNRGPLRLILDEAHVFAPQGRISDPNSGKMLHAANNLVSLGRSIGLRIVLISQRPAKLHKDSLTQVETLVAMRLIAPQDRGAVEDWIGEWAEKGQGKEIIASLPSLPTGDAWIWSPEANFLERVHFPLSRTYDSGKAPTDGGDAPELKPLDVATVNALLEKAADDLKANDPRVLKSEISRLQRELAAEKKRVPVDIKVNTQPAAEQMSEIRGQLKGVEARAVAAEAKLAKIAKIVGSPAYVVSAKATTPKLAAAIAAAPGGKIRMIKNLGPDSTECSDIPSGCAAPLAALAGVYPSGLTEAQWAVTAGYRRTSSTWRAYKSRLGQAGLIEKRDGKFFATDAGARAVGDVELPPKPGADLVRWWAQRISGTRPIAEALIEAYPNGLSKEDLAERVSMSHASSTFRAYLSRLTSPGLISRDGGIRLVDEVMAG